MAMPVVCWQQINTKTAQRRMKWNLNSFRKFPKMEIAASFGAAAVILIVGLQLLTMILTQHVHCWSNILRIPANDT